MDRQNEGREREGGDDDDKERAETKLLKHFLQSKRRPEHKAAETAATTPLQVALFVPISCSEESLTGLEEEGLTCP